MNALGRNLRDLRIAAGLTQPQLAERAGIEQGYLSKLENARAAPSHEVLERLAAALSVPPEQLTAPDDTRRSGNAMYVLGAVFGVAAVVVGVLVASSNEPAPQPMVPPGGPLSLSQALDLAPDTVQIHVLVGGEPGGVLSVRGRAADERAVRAYLGALERFGRVTMVDIDPQPWWRLGAVGFTIGVQVAESQGGEAGAVSIRLHEDTERARAAREQLVRILATYDLKPWLFTDEVRIRSGVIPHSHPVLTVGTQSLDNDPQQLSTFVHEQLHWFADARPDAIVTAKAALRARYPDAPAGGPEGARDLESTYLHLVVCWLEFDAMTRLLGEEAARALLEDRHYYTWIYRTVLADTAALGDLIRAHGLYID